MADLPGRQENASWETLAGTVERVTFHSSESGFAVLRVKARGKRDLVTVVGHSPFIAAGEFVTASGVWNNDRNHGLQFKAEVLKSTPPTSSEGIERYLASGQMRGIGPAMAKRIVAEFGEATFDIIEASPDRLIEVAGIGPTRASRITAGWAEQKAVREIMIFLHAHGVGTARAVRIFKTYGHEAIQVMTDDPYRLARDVRGIGFRTADAIAAKLGMQKTAPQRLRAGISFALQTSTDQGHCALPIETLIRLAEDLLGVSSSLVRDAIENVLAEGEVVSDTIAGEPCLFLRGLHIAERTIAERLRVRTSGTPPWPAIDLDRAVPWVEAKTGRTLADSQRAALDLVLASKVAVITGGAGGIGKAAARMFVAEGADVLLVDRDEAALKAAAAEIGSNRVATCVADVTSPESNQAMVQAAVERFGGIDVFLANAGIEGKVAPISDTEVEMFDRVMAVNVRGVWLGLKYVMPEIAKRGGGSVVITSSVAGVGGSAGLAPYVTSKHAVIGLMRSAALEGAPVKIRVNTVNPSPVETRMMRSLEEGMAPGNGEVVHQSLKQRIPLGRYGEPEDIARLMLFLSSDDSAFLTGGVYMADGGMTAS